MMWITSIRYRIPPSTKWYGELVIKKSFFPLSLSILRKRSSWPWEVTCSIQKTSIKSKYILNWQVSLRTCIFKQISGRISKNPSMDQATSMDVLNSAIHIIVDVGGIKLKLGVDKILDHVCNKTRLKNSKKRKLQSNRSEMAISTVPFYWLNWPHWNRRNPSIPPDLSLDHDLCVAFHTCSLAPSY